MIVASSGSRFPAYTSFAYLLDIMKVSPGFTKSVNYLTSAKATIFSYIFFKLFSPFSSWKTCLTIFV